MRNGKGYGEKKKPLTEKAMEGLQGRIKKDPKLMRKFVRDFEKGLASEGLFVTKEFQKKLAREAENDMKNAMKKIPAREKKLYKKVQNGDLIKIKVKIDRKRKAKSIKIL